MTVSQSHGKGTEKGAELCYDFCIPGMGLSVPRTAGGTGAVQRCYIWGSESFDLEPILLYCWICRALKCRAGLTNSASYESLYVVSFDSDG